VAVGRLQRVLVTGASGGIGLVVATELARSGAQVIVHARDPQRGASALAHITRQVPGALTELLITDFEDLSAVSSAAQSLLLAGAPLDVFVANAGAIYPKRMVTIDGNEATFQVNHLAHFLLARLLAPLLSDAPAARVITVTSDAHWAAWRGIDFEDLAFERHWSPFRAYARTKLANILFCREHASRLTGTAITSNAVHPGLVRSGFGSAGYGPYGRFIGAVSPVVAHTPEEGADSIVWLANSPQVEGVSGTYFFHRRPHRSSPAAQDPSAQRKLWEASEQLTSAWS
jgi:retinol dehydrogenase 12